MSIPVQQAREILTKAYMEVYKELVPAPMFMQSFFTVKTSDAQQISIEVQRGTERIAVDVLRGVDGKRNSFSKSTEKNFVPPFYNENFDATSLDRYDRVFGQEPTFTARTIGYLADDIAVKLAELRSKIVRARELQCASVFETGVVVVKNGDSIDFKRKAASLVDLNAGEGGYWSVAATDIDAQISKGGQFIRNTGKNATSELNLILSDLGFAALKKTNFFKDSADYRRADLMSIGMPQKMATGGTYHGTMSAGSYIVHIWTYNDIYEDANGVQRKYFDEKKAFLVPTSGTKFTLAHAGIPAIITDVTKKEFNQYIVQQESEFWVNNYIDPKAKAHIFEMLSAPLAVPVTVDMIYTMKILA